MKPRREGLVFIAVAAIFLFASAATFQTMGIVLFAMMDEFHWSEAAEGGAYLALGLVCAVSAMLPVALIPRIGARWTLVCGGAILALGFFVAYKTSALSIFYLAAGLFGLAFSLVANTSGIYLIAGWFGDRSPRMIGFYLMSGALGGAVGPPVAEALISSSGGWRLHWLAMMGVALLLAAFCAVVVREPQAASAPALNLAAEDGWGYREALLTPQFLVIALAMVATQTCLITVSGVAVPHFVHLGWSSGFAARILGLQALVGTAATGVFGWMTKRYDPKAMLVAGLLAEASGVILLAFAHEGWAAYAFVPIYGIGWSVTSLAVTVLLIRYFGGRSGSAALSTIWMFAGVATAGPWLAGLVADRTGSFAPTLSALGLLLVPIAAASWIMGSPRRPFRNRLVSQLQRD